MTISRPKATNCFAALRKKRAERIGFYTELAEAAERKKGLSRETIFAGR